MSKEKISILLKSFSQRPVAYQKIYAQITGSVTAGLLLSQILYWWYAVEEREFYKTDKEFREELAMGPREFKTAKSRLKMLKLVSTTVKGIPAQTYYRLQETQLLAQICSWVETHQLDKPKRPDCTGRNVSTITKTNARDYIENTKKQKEKVSPKEVLDLDLKIAEARNKFCDEVEQIFHLTQIEKVTFSRITKHLVNLCQTGEAELTIFEDAIGWAKEAKANGRRPKALFVAKVKQEAGFKAQSKVL